MKGAVVQVQLTAWYTETMRLNRKNQFLCDLLDSSTGSESTLTRYHLLLDSARIQSESCGAMSCFQKFFLKVSYIMSTY